MAFFLVFSGTIKTAQSKVDMLRQMKIHDVYTSSHILWWGVFDRCPGYHWTFHIWQFWPGLTIGAMFKQTKIFNLYSWYDLFHPQYALQYIFIVFLRPLAAFFTKCWRENASLRWEVQLTAKSSLTFSSYLEPNALLIGPWRFHISAILHIRKLKDL